MMSACTTVQFLYEVDVCYTHMFYFVDNPFSPSVDDSQWLVAYLASLDLL